MKTLVLFLTSLALPLSAVADLGFFTDFPENPRIERASESVFQVYAPSGQLVQLPRSQSEELIAQFSDEDPIQAVVLMQLRACLTTDSELCYFFNDVSWGSAFLVGDGSELWSAFHVFRDAFFYQMFYLSQEEDPLIMTVAPLALEKMQNLSMPYLVLNKDKEVVFHGSEPVAINTPFDNLEILRRPSFTSATWNDFVKIRLPRSLGRGLPLAATAPHPGDEIFGIGFPFATEGRERFEVANSTGDRQFITRGAALSIDEALERTQQNISDPSQLRDSTLANQADSMFGMSGGPFLNSQGEVTSLLVLFSVEGSDLSNLGQDNYSNLGPSVSTVQALP